MKLESNWWSRLLALDHQCLEEPVLMNITLREIDRANLHHINQCDTSFVVDSKMILSAEHGKINYTVESVSAYTKQYAPSLVDYSEYISNPHKIVFFAFVDDELAGQIRLQKYWNGYAYMDDFAVEPKYRRRGVGRALTARAMEWARERKLPGIMLETQNNNVAACKLYESCGFELRGFDFNLYKAINPSTDEIALYWYLLF